MGKIILVIGLIAIWLFLSTIVLSIGGWIPRSIAQPIIDTFMLSIIIGGPVAIIQAWRYYE